MENTDSKTPVVEDIETIKRSNALAIHLYKTAESDLSIIMKQHSDLIKVYSKMCEKIPEADVMRTTTDMLISNMSGTIDILKKNQENREQMAK